MYYHASQTPGITVLEPRISNHNQAFVYFSTKRENVLVYLSNAIEKYCKETAFTHEGIWKKWGPYGFEADGTQRMEEYYPNAIEDTYKGVSGYIYCVKEIPHFQENIQISNAVTTTEHVVVDGCEYIEDAYKAIMEASKNDLIKIQRYEEMSEQKHTWIKNTMKQEYDEAREHPEYRHFLKGKFHFLELENADR